MTSPIKRFSSVLVLVAVVGLGASTTPARAAAYSFSDPAGDAKSFVVDDAPKESDPELDILSVTFSSDADSRTVMLSAFAGDLAAAPADFELVL